MSVLVEALSLIVKKFDLDTRYPGGIDAFLAEALQLPVPPRFIVSLDPHLVSLSFYDPEQLEACAILLQKQGFLEAEEKQAADFVLIDQRYGPTLPCPWVEWHRHEDGFTHAWLAGTDAGDMAAPEDWTPEQSKQLTRGDIRDEEGRAIKLAEEDGLETWLDTKSGRVITSLPQRDEPASDFDIDLDEILRELAIEEAAEQPLRRAIWSVLGELGLKDYAEEVNKQIRVFTYNDDVAYGFTFVPNEDSRAVLCVLAFPEHVAPCARAAMCEAITRANWHLSTGNFEMDMDDGEVQFRHVIATPNGGNISAASLDGLMRHCAFTMERYRKAFMAVIRGRSTPAQAITGVIF